MSILWRGEGSNEEKMGEATEGRASRVKYREALLEWGGGGGRLVKILWDACEDLVGLSMCDGMIETVKYI